MTDLDPVCPATAQKPRLDGHLLCIDDNAVNGLLMQEFFALRLGLRVKVASNGADGLAMARSDPPLAVLLDLMLPDLDGLQVLERLRADPRTRALPVAIVSGHVSVGDRARARHLGAQACWTKPLDLSMLDRALVDLLARAEARPESA